MAEDTAPKTKTDEEKDTEEKPEKKGLVFKNVAGIPDGPADALTPEYRKWMETNRPDIYEQLVKAEEDFALKEAGEDPAPQNVLSPVLAPQFVVVKTEPTASADKPSDSPAPQVVVGLNRPEPRPAVGVSTFSNSPVAAPTNPPNQPIVVDAPKSDNK